MNLSDPDVWLLFGSGLIGGCIAGMLGIGGGVIYVAIFTSFLRTNLPDDLLGDPLVKYTIANSVFALTFAGLGASAGHIIKKTFHIRPVLLIGLGGAITAVITTHLIKDSHYSAKAFALLFSLLLIPVILRTLLSKQPDGQPHELRNELLYFPTGLAAGVIMGLSGLGGGIILVPVLAGLMRMPIKKAVSISLGAFSVTGIALSVYNICVLHLPDADLGATLGPILLPMTLPVVVGVLLAAPLGVTLGQRAKPNLIKVMFAIVCLTVISKMFIEFVV